MRYALVISDLGGVVVHFDSDRMVHQAAQLIGRPFEEVQQVVYDKALLLPFELGRISPQAYYHGLKERLKLAWTYEQFVRIWNDIFSENHDVIRLMKRLREGYRLTALTNTNTLHIEHMKRTIPALNAFHDIVASCDVGTRKPEPEIYRLAARRAGVRLHEAVYIDDREEMVEGARMVGMAAIRFESLQQLEHELRSLGINA